ncbi:FAD:protein FMN transferase [Companilactobacillus huachuanensis]|uniref:FAD:protein FMN transferase n=1 Tax=Companilactobacillus huachuanensis TaxID=2559914 RepID=A0ABW1RJR1_9LACO|nr:FAD:protein FMN transferase [Companilactobacillus huachuanensis]
MKTNQYFFPNQVIEQMNIPFTVKLATTDPDEVVMEQLKLATDKINHRLVEIDRDFSPFRTDSLVSKYQRGDRNPILDSNDFQIVYGQAILAEQMTDKIFTPYFDGKFDPTGLVKGWAIEQTFDKYLTPLLDDPKIEGISLNGGGDIKFATKVNSEFCWGIGIEDPDNLQRILATYYLKNGAIATSGDSKRGEHIVRQIPNKIEQVTVVDKSLVTADIWATVGVSAGLDKFSEFVEKYQLSGIIIDQHRSPINFSEGMITNVEKTPL